MQEELNFWDWTGKVAERLTFIRLKVADRKDITEEDYGLLEMLHKPFFNGEMPIYQAKLELNDEKATQQGLFGQNVSNNCSGTDLAIPTVN